MPEGYSSRYYTSRDSCRTAYEQDSRSISLFDQCKHITQLKRIRTQLATVNAQVLQNVALRLDLAFKGFLRRTENAGEKPGYPRFKAEERYHSITFPQYPSGCAIKEGKIVVQNVGHVKIRLHRDPQGTVKTATIKQTSTGKWFLTLSCVVATKQKVPMAESVGIDLV